MDFSHNQDRQMLARTLDRFIADRYAPEVRNRAAYGPAGYSPDIWGQLADLGVIGALVSEADGGFGGAGFDIMAVFESLGRGLVAEPFLTALLASRALGLGGGRAALIEAIVAGQAIVAFAHQEPGDIGVGPTLATLARPLGEGWRLTGAKAVVGHLAAAGSVLVSARVEGGDPDAVSLFLVPTDAVGVRVRGYGDIDGGGSGELTLEDAVLGADALVGKLHGAGPILEAAQAYGALALAAEALGAMEVVKDHTVEFLRTRFQFGVAIGGFQALQHRMADLLIEIEQARSAVINAAAAVDGPRLARERAVSAAKYTVGKVGARVAEEAIQMHGGIGMTWELPLSHYAKRLVMIDHQLGDEDLHLARYIALSTQTA
ncbi:acyl-CoA dehydrogenase family protein [Caulobacter soli]|uniref:acyl-CoA dehydrogenase family protein n=1 Tax=Caulobacter soli TaxID=2708539 RepID=UPI0013ECC90A|nr:acyl-CoA dehydrogenase [Caulobacter soli]